MKKVYINPIIEKVELEDILDVINPGTIPEGEDADAKKNDIMFDWDDDEAIFKDLWAEDEEEEKKELW